MRNPIISERIPDLNSIRNVSSGLLSSNNDNSELSSDIYSIPINVITNNNDNVNLNLVYQDTMPHGSMIGTYFCIHGSPGSHKDFKYITPILTNNGIRVIGINWPGLGYTNFENRMNHDNYERQQIINQLINKLKLEKIIFSGHSRGTENAIISAAENEDKTTGVVLINPIGLRIHKGIRPFWSLQLVATMWKYQWLRYISESFLYFFYTKVLNFKVKQASECGICVQHMSHCAINKQKPYFDKISSNKDVKLIILAAGKDNLVEKEIMIELMNTCKNMKKIEINDDDDIKVTEIMKNELKSNNLGLMFNNEGHFLNKYKAQLIADIVINISKNQHYNC